MIKGEGKINGSEIGADKCRLATMAGYGAVLLSLERRRKYQQLT
jgi:hypothetical protein